VVGCRSLHDGPPLGIAHRMNDKTVLRGGFGISIDLYPFSRAMRDPEVCLRPVTSLSAPAQE
jgi:hypothetical protein